MEELLATCAHKSLSEVRGGCFVDTCFLIDDLKHHRAGEVEGLYLLSFNAEELVHVAKHLPSDIKHEIRSFLKGCPLTIVDVGVSPGDQAGEESYVRSVDEELLRLVRDPSDAVLLAAALKGRCAVLTKDKHHLFTAALENYVSGSGVRVFKEYKDYASWREHHSPSAQ